MEAGPPVAEAHVAIGVVPTFFAENPRQWFQTAETQFATTCPTPNNGQKYFHLLPKLPADIMSNCSDIITTCTIAAASNNGDPYTAMKEAILEYTRKPKWSCYMDLHSLPPQGDIRPSLLMAKLTSSLPHGTPTNTDLFFSFFMFRMPQYLSPPCRRRRSRPTPRAVLLAAPTRPGRSLPDRLPPLTEQSPWSRPDTSHTGIPR
jgi:hypothetical protein